MDNTMDLSRYAVALNETRNELSQWLFDRSLNPSCTTRAKQSPEERAQRLFVPRFARLREHVNDANQSEHEHHDSTDRCLANHPRSQHNDLNDQQRDAPQLKRPRHAKNDG